MCFDVIEATVFSEVTPPSNEIAQRFPLDILKPVGILLQTWPVLAIGEAFLCKSLLNCLSERSSVSHRRI
jgi:hypothetical protein